MMPIDAAIIFFYRRPFQTRSAQRSPLGPQHGQKARAAGLPEAAMGYAGLSLRSRRPHQSLRTADVPCCSSWSVAVFMRARARALHHLAQVSAATQNLAIMANGGRPYGPWPCTQAITALPSHLPSDRGCHAENGDRRGRALAPRLQLQAAQRVDLAVYLSRQSQL